MGLSIKKNKKILLISGLDPSGRAGLITDLGIAQYRGVLAAACVTALTAQNESRFLKPQVVDKRVFKNMLKSILPLSQYGAIKIGMLGDEKIIRTLLPHLKTYAGPVILDPVTRSSTGGLLLTNKGQQALTDELLPWVSLWTPNLDEARHYLGHSSRIQDPRQLIRALFEKYPTPVYLKGGHLKGDPTDLFFDGTDIISIKSPRIRKQFRGTGCRLATLLACCAVDEKISPRLLKKSRSNFQKFLMKY